jgi:hypothetical protein
VEEGEGEAEAVEAEGGASDDNSDYRALISVYNSVEYRALRHFMIPVVTTIITCLLPRFAASS